MADTFDRPTVTIAQQNTYSDTEVGITHLSAPSFIKLLDNGDVEIMVEDGLGIVMNASSKSITFMGHAIRFLTTDTNGLVWNRTAFNDQATTYTEAAMINLTDSDLSQLFAGVENYLPGSS